MVGEIGETIFRRLFHILLLFEAELLAEVLEIREENALLLRPDPPDPGILPAEVMAIFRSQSCLVNAAHAGDCGDRRSFVGAMMLQGTPAPRSVQ